MVVTLKSHQKGKIMELQAIVGIVINELKRQGFELTIDENIYILEKDEDIIEIVRDESLIISKL